MRLTNVLHLYRIRLRPRLLQEVLAILGISVGVALVYASLVANASLTGSVEQLTRGVVGDMRLQLAARGSGGLPEGVLDDVRRLDGVAHAASLLETRAVVAGPRGDQAVVLFAGDASLARWGGRLLRPFASPRLARRRAVALPAPVARAIGVPFDGELDVVTGAGATRSVLGARLADDEIGDLVHSPVVLAPLPYAQEISGLQGRVSRVFVEPEDGRDADVAAALRRIAAGRANVLPADADVDVFSQAAMPTRQSTALFSVLAALVGFLFAMSAVLLTIPQRRRFIADLRYAGHPPGSVLQVMAADAIVLGLVGSIAGVALGDQLSRHLFGSVPGYLSFAFPLGSQRVVPWSSVALAVAAGVVSGCVAVLAPLRDIFSGRIAGPQHRGRGAASSGAVLAAGGACLGVVALVLTLAPQLAIAATILLAAAMLLLLPTLLRLGVEALAWLGQWSKSPSPAIATMELRSRSAGTRTLALAATGAVAVFGSVAIGGAHGDLERGLNRSASELDANADLWATFPGAPNAFATTPFTIEDDALDRVRALPGVAAVRLYRGAFLDIGDRRLWVLAPPADAPMPIPPSQIDTDQLRPATDQVRSGRSIVLSEAVAEELGVAEGDAIDLPSPVPTTFRVAALSTNLGWPPGALIVSADGFARAWGSSQPTALQVETAAGADIPEVGAAMRSALGSSLPLTLETTSERERRHHDASSEGLSRLSDISVLVLGAAILAMATAMAGVLWQRRATFAGLKVDGFSESELWRAMLLETTVLLGIASFVGAAFGLVGQVLLSRALESVTGFPVFYSAALAVAVVILAIVTAVTGVMLAGAGYLAVRVRPMPGVGG